MGKCDRCGAEGVSTQPISVGAYERSYASLQWVCARCYDKIGKNDEDKKQIGKDYEEKKRKRKLIE